MLALEGYTERRVFAFGYYVGVGHQVGEGLVDPGRTGGSTRVYDIALPSKWSHLLLREVATSVQTQMKCHLENFANSLRV